MLVCKQFDSLFYVILNIFSEKLELVFLKLGLAETDDELQTIVNNYLNPVLLILATSEESIRIKVSCLQVLVEI